MDMWEMREKEEAREQIEMDKWKTLEYSPEPCPNCGRQRVELTANGKHWCEKCCWVVEDNKFFIPEWRM